MVAAEIVAEEEPIVAAEPELPVRKSSATRPTVEFLVVLLIGILFARAFGAEAYIVPTGSMAPTLLGMHRDYRCPHCERRFAVGVDENGQPLRAVCPNCGQGDLAAASASESLGDRLLVQKYAYELRSPRRWEVVVFQNPSDPTQAYVKRVVGLPGDSLLISGGDVLLDGKIARKTLLEAKAMAIPVYHHDYLSQDIARYPRFAFRRGDFRRPLDSGWKAEGARFVRAATGESSDRPDWIEYRHWQPDRGTYGPIRDFTPYNGADVPGDNRIKDLILTAQISLGPGISAVVARMDSGSDRFAVSLPLQGSAEVRRNGRLLKVRELGPKMRSSTAKTAIVQILEVAIVDRRLSVALDGKPVFEPIDFEDPTIRAPTGLSPVALGVVGDGVAEVKGIKIERDVFYTDSLSQSPKRPFGVEVPYSLGQGEYFVLGDNSPVSNDSRFWPDSPVVTREHLLGKPFLVHLPSQAVPLEVFGRELYWIPDPREIRYIR